jgi:hypothetical protein
MQQTKKAKRRPVGWQLVFRRSPITGLFGKARLCPVYAKTAKAKRKT